MHVFNCCLPLLFVAAIENHCENVRCRGFAYLSAENLEDKSERTASVFKSGSLKQTLVHLGSHQS